MKNTWAHLHLPKLQAGELDVISVKVPGQRIGYAAAVTLSDASFRVSEPGRQRCLREGVRNVHAWVVGVEVGSVSGTNHRPDAPEGFRRALYDPWKGGTFVDSETLEPVLDSPLVVMSGKHVYYLEEL